MIKEKNDFFTDISKKNLDSKYYTDDFIFYSFPAGNFRRGLRLANLTI